MPRRHLSALKLQNAFLAVLMPLVLLPLLAGCGALEGTPLESEPDPMSEEDPSEEVEAGSTLGSSLVDVDASLRTACPAWTDEEIATLLEEWKLEVENAREAGIPRSEMLEGLIDEPDCDNDCQACLAALITRVYP